MQKISSIYQFILEMNQILEILDLKGHNHLTMSTQSNFLAFLTMYEHVKDQLNSFIHS